MSSPVHVVAPSRSLRQDELADLAARGRPLGERLRRPSAVDAAHLAGGQSERLLERWRRLVAPGNPATFDKRLSWDGLDLAQVRAALGPPPPPSEDGLPSWAETVGEVLDAAAGLAARTSPGALPTDRCLLDGYAIAFQEILLPFVLVARDRLGSTTGPLVEQLSPDAAATIEHRLLQRLTEFCASPLLVEFAIRRERRQSSLSRLVASLQGPPGTEQYREFTDAMLATDLAALFRTYPVMARLAATVTEQWVDATAEFLHRLAEDRTEIQQRFHPEVELGRVVEVGRAVSDAHHDGRAVLAVTFESGLRLVYKPKDLHLEQAYVDLLGWLEERGTSLPLHRLRIVVRPGYGWSEHAATLPVEDHAAARRFYRRAGMLLGLLYGLAGNDCHYDNIVAHGEHPLLVDMETLMHPQPQPFEDDAAAEMLGARAVSTEVFRASVLTTGLLPRWQVNQDGRAHDSSGLGGVDEQQSLEPYPRWVDVNTDAMTVKHEYLYYLPTQNVAVLDGKPLSPNDFVEEIVDGLREMYLLLLDHRAALVAPGGPLEAFAGQPVRYLLRDTRTYALVLQRAMQRQNLRDGAAFSIELDVLSRALATTVEPSLFWPMRRDEQDAMERLDVPFFAAPSDRVDLPLAGGGIIENAFASAGFDLAVSRLGQLSPEDLARQVAYTRTSLYSRSATSLSELSTTEPLDPDVSSSPLTRPELVAQAEAIARELDEQAIRSPDGGTSWIGVAFMPQAERYQLEPTGFDLYSGNPGIALFYATLAEVTGSVEARSQALSAVRQVSQMVRAHPERLVQGLGIGGGSGIGSLAYALARTGSLLDDADLLADAERAADLITVDRIDADRGLDVLVGAAGALLSLLAVHRVTGRSQDLDRAVRCGRRVVAAQLTGGPASGSWPSLGQVGMTGFSHGAAGIAYALLRLAETTGDPSFRQAAINGIAYETGVFAADEGNWPDVRDLVLAASDGQPVFLAQWCHGAAGIGMARLAGLAELDDAGVRHDIGAALEATLRFGPNSVDHLCCGTMGRSDLLLSAGLRLDRPDLVEEAARFAAVVVRRAESTGYRVLGRLPHGVGCPGLFQGTAGVGYQLLRLARPDRVPSVLVWD